MTEPAPLRLAMSGVATPETLEAIQAFVVEGCRKAGADEAATFDFRLAVDEACTNVAVHGYAGGGPGPIDVVLESDGARIRVSITDRGVPFRPELVAAPDLDAEAEDRLPGGLGWHLIRNLMDEIEYHSGPEFGNRLVIARQLRS
ncbi:MAG: ATP-binding protein [Acidobacteriota bacterium]